MPDLLKLLTPQTEEPLLLEAIRTVWRFEDEAAVPALTTLLKETESENVASSIAYALYRLGARDAIPAIKKALEKLGASGNSHLLTALAWFQERSVIPFLQERLQRPRHFHNFVFAAIESTGKFLPEDWARECLIAELEEWGGSNFDDLSQQYAVLALARSEPNLLMERFGICYDQERVHQSACKEFIAWLPRFAQRAETNQRLLLAALQRLICDHRLITRELTGHALTKVPLAIFNQLYDNLIHSSDEWKRACAVYALGWRDETESAIRTTRTSADFMSRHFADVAWKNFRRRQSLKEYLRAYQSEDGATRLNAYFSIIEKGDEEDVSELVEATPQTSLQRIYLNHISQTIEQRLRNERQAREREEKQKLDATATIYYD